ncbi:MAG: serine/threonine-protein kinase [Halieaceae bacterium]|jgi:serine/threonine-protein kinase|nr:serine/threonine-protein kinase [Halieaceae bacterium]
MRPQESIPGYRLDYRIGGGTSDVYKGEYQGVTVAVKILHAEIDGTARKRFEYESLFLQRLRHPNIAEFIETGVTSDDRPFVTTRYFEGAPITQYATDRALDTSARVRLLLECCRILHFAHWRGVVHRDVKPANILVNQEGTLKVLDFGVAMGDLVSLQDANLTEQGQFLGTLPYMSPEQVSSQTDSLTSATDTYSLGVVGYELLTGKLPVPVAGLPIQAALEAIQRNVIPPASSAARGCDRQLDAVLNKMLAREPVDRYNSLAEVAEDLQRWLDGQLVLAQMPTLGAELRHLIRRNQLLAGTVAMVFSVTLLAAGVSTWFAWRENQARQESELQLARTQGLSTFLVEMLQSSNPERGGSQALTVKEVMLKAAGDVQNKISDDPQIEATIRCTLAVSLLVLGDQASSEIQATRGNELVADATGSDAWEECRLALGQAQFYRLDRDTARATLKDLLSRTRKRRFSTEVLTKAELNIAIADNYDGQHQAAYERMKALVETPFEILAEDDEYRLYGVHEYGVSLYSMGRFEEAAEVMEHSIDLRTRKYSATHPQTLFSLSYLGYIRREQGRYEEAVEIAKRAAAARAEAYGPEHRQTLLSFRDVLEAALLAGDRETSAEMAALLTEEVSRMDDVHVLKLSIKQQLGNFAAAQKQWSDAEEIFQEIVDYLDGLESRPLARTLLARRDYGKMLAAAGREGEARQQYEIGFRDTARLLGEDHPYHKKFSESLAQLECCEGQDSR